MQNRLFINETVYNFKLRYWSEYKRMFNIGYMHFINDNRKIEKLKKLKIVNWKIEKI